MNNWEEEFKEKFLTNKSYYQSKNGIVYWSELLEHIHSLLKRQREICADTFMKPDFANSDSKNYAYQLNLSTWNEIRNAPEPSEEKLSGISFR